MRIALSLGPDVESLERFPLRVDVEASDETVESVTVEFVMKGMEMGLNRYRLSASEDGAWEGTAVLPVCSSGRLDWLATVTVSTQGGRWVAVFPFVTKK